MGAPTNHRHLCRLGPVALLLVLIGCGQAAAPLPAADPAQARRTLHQALDAWRDGQPAESLVSSAPPVRVIDEDWRAGLRLESYEVAPRDRILGPALRCEVTLRLRDGAGKSIRKIVPYDVTTGPAPSVIRQD